MSSIIGELSEIKKGMEVEWIINDFFTFAEESDVKYNSPSFDFSGATWYLRIYPNGRTTKDTSGALECYLLKHESDFKITLSYKLGIKKRGGDMDDKCNYTSTFEEKELGYGCSGIISTSELLERKYDLAPNNVLTIICRMTLGEVNIVSSK